jgi:hypothetical protein
MPRPGASCASAPGLASSHRHRSGVPLVTPRAPPSSDGVLRQRRQSRAGHLLAHGQPRPRLPHGQPDRLSRAGPVGGQGHGGQAKDAALLVRRATSRGSMVCDASNRYAARVRVRWATGTMSTPSSGLRRGVPWISPPRRLLSLIAKALGLLHHTKIAVGAPAPLGSPGIRKYQS